MTMLRNGCETVIRVDRLVAFYGDRRVLNSIDLTVRAGEIIAIMGGSGAGKSTLMRHMLGLEKPHSGNVQLLGRDLHRLSRAEQAKLRRNIGVAFQGGAMFSSMSLRENIEMPLCELTKLDQATIRIMTRMKLELVGLAEFEHLMPSELSGGMLKRGALARAIVMDPQLLFIDEPSSGLDPVTAVELDELILKLRAALNMTIVVVTHAVESALKVADRITVLSDGKILVTDTVEAVRNFDHEHVQNLLYRKPSNRKRGSNDYLKRLVSDA